MTNYTNIESFDPRECLSGQISRIHRLSANIFRKHIAPFNVTNSQLTLLFILSKHTALTQKQLSTIAKLEKSSLNRNIKRLIDKNYVSKRAFPLIQITNDGKKMVNTIIPEWEKAMSEIREVIGKDGESSIHKIHQNLTTKT